LGLLGSLGSLGSLSSLGSLGGAGWLLAQQVRDERGVRGEA
jgi:hypothetical protein